LLERSRHLRAGLFSFRRCAAGTLLVFATLFEQEDFWPAVHRRADTEPQPPRDAFAELLQTLRQPLALNRAQAWFAESLTARHRYDDTHPALVDHDHIGGEEHAPEPVFGHAAEAPTAPPDAPLDPAPVDDPPVIEYSQGQGQRRLPLWLKIIVIVAVTLSIGYGCYCACIHAWHWLTDGSIL